MSPSNALLRALAALEAALRATGARHMLIGGMAVIARGVKRHTDDLDATVWGDDVSLDDLFRALAKEKIEPRVADARKFAATRQVLLLLHTPTGVSLEVSIGWLPFELEALERAELLKIGRTRLPVGRAEDLVVYKVVAWRDRDKSDVERLLRLYGKQIDLARVRALAVEFAEALDAPERIAEFDALVRRTVRHRRRS